MIPIGSAMWNGWLSVSDEVALEAQNIHQIFIKTQTISEKYNISHLMSIF